MNLTRAALTTAALLTLAGLAGAPVLAAEATAEPTAEPNTEPSCGSPLVLFSPGARVEGSSCSVVSTVDQELQSLGPGGLLPTMPGTGWF
ncbi:hypothetical protein [Nocardiopsis sp. RV163]|uniref:hypothetical protein n=1 Tax=Nocardiopsis sp. RV163 TaxID=1661388 RepID=UPI00064B85DF|nr:hypothetical protein [Nocardiopsis sp. RV163]